MESQKAMLQDLKGFRDIDSAEHFKELQDEIEIMTSEYNENSIFFG